MILTNRKKQSILYFMWQQKKKSFLPVLIVFLLTVFSFSFGKGPLIQGAYTPSACPQVMHLNTEVPDCQTFCSELTSKFGSDFNLCSTMGTITSNPTNYCSCLLVVGSSSQCLDINVAKTPPSGYFWCEYQISNFKKQASKFVSSPFFSSNIPETMVKMATFDGSSPSLSLPGATGIIFDGLYTAYVAAISGITTSFALIILIIVSGWNLGLSLFTRFVKRMEGVETPWSTMTSSYWHGKAMMVIPAAAFFSLPLPLHSKLLKPFNVGLPQHKTNIMQITQSTSPSGQPQPGISSSTPSGSSSSTSTSNYNPSANSVLSQQIGNLKKQCKQMSNQLSNVEKELPSAKTAVQTDYANVQSACNLSSASSSTPSVEIPSSSSTCPSGYTLVTISTTSGSSATTSSSSSICVLSSLGTTTPATTSTGGLSCPKGYLLSYGICIQETPCQSALQTWQDAKTNYENLQTEKDNLQSQIQECYDQVNEANSAKSAIKRPPKNSDIAPYKFPSVSSLRLPLALGVVKAFINQGLDYGNTVAGIASGYIESYTIYKISHQIAIARQMNQEAQQSYQKEIDNLSKMWASIVKGNPQCFAGMTMKAVCSSKSNVLSTDIIEKYPQCKVIFNMARSMCSDLSEYQPPKPPPSNNSTASTVASALGPIQSATGFLYPAFIPEVSVYSLFQAVSQPTDYKATAILTHYDLVYVNNGKDTYIATGESMLQQLKGSILAVNHTSMENLSPTAGLGFVLGEVTAIDAVPPGSTIAHMTAEISKALGSAAGKLVSVAFQSIKLPIGNSAYRSFIDVVTGGWKKVGTYTADAYGMFVSFGLAVTLLKFIPFFIVSFAVLGRFFGYFLGVMKFVLGLPFYAVAVATERPGSWSSFFKHTVKFTMVPPALAFVPLVAFAVIELSRFLFFDIPSYFILSFTPNTFVGEFMAGFGIAFMYVVSTGIAIVLAWEVAFNFIDGLFEFLEELIGRGSDTAVQSFRTIGSIVKYRFASGLAQGA